MVDKNSLDFLPKVFQTKTNQRFLNATIDQLIQEPNLGRIYGYIGRQDLSPAYRVGDPYVQETDSYSQFYQLEPGLVINKRVFNTKNFKTENAYNYVDLLNSITANGGITTNHDRLFSNEYYNYEGFVDLDKLINYGKYYWVPDGPLTLDINTGGVLVTDNFTVSRPTGTDLVINDFANQIIGQVGYNVDRHPNQVNPTITLARGGNYTFNVGQVGHPFWIQTESGIDEGTGYQANINKRQVLGVENNGAESGLIRFNVPKKDSQNYFESMTQFETVDMVTDLAFNDLYNADYNEFMSSHTIDGNRSFVVKTILMTNDQDDKWYNDQSVNIPVEQRRGIWQISNVEGVIKLTYIKDWPVNTKIFVREGVSYGNLYVFKDSLLNINKMPNITANRDMLYYQDGADPNVYGIIKLVEQGPISEININDILQQKQYTSPNGVTFTNGLKIKFSGAITPEFYKNKEFIVEGVGTAIALVPYANLVSPDPNNPNIGSGYSSDYEPFDYISYDTELNAPLRKDYIVINRASVDGNAWSRTNRWFHEDVIRYAATFKDPTASVNLDNNFRAIRPIIEFDANLRLFNHGNKFAGPVTVVDSYVTDLSNQVEGHSPYVLIDSNGNYYSDNVALEDGTYVVFIDEKYANTKNKIYYVENIKPYTPAVFNKSTTVFAAKGKTVLKFSTANDLLINMKVVGLNLDPATVILDIDYDARAVTLSHALLDDIPVATVITFDTNNSQVHLTPVHDMVEGESVVAVSGASGQNKTYWWNNNAWKPAQQKFSLNQSPMFDIFDINDNSFGDSIYYPSTGFVGSKLFGYVEGTTGNRDSELGIILSYKSIGNIGDILFENFYDTETFNYSYNNADKVVNVNSGYAHEYVVTDASIRLKNNWVKIADRSKQYIQKKFTATRYKVNNFAFDIKYVNSINEKNIFVFVNGKELDRRTDYILLGNATQSQINLTNNLVIDDELVIKVYGLSLSNKENYTLPKNLTENSENNTFANLTLGQIRNHLNQIVENSLDVTTNTYGNNNLRDTNYKVLPGKILQHASGIHIAQLLFNNESTNIIKAIDFNRKSYNRFKDRFFYLLSSIEFTDYEDARACLDTIMEEIVANSSTDQPFYYTDMMPYGMNRYIQNDYPVYDTNYRKFNLINTYLIDNPGYQAVLVYLNGSQLLNQTDYTNDGNVITLSSTLTLTVNDTVTIYEYDSTEGCMIPATPTKLGLYPKFTPQIYQDNTYISQTLNIIQGHDGSKTIAFNDFRDQIILELEKRIYNNINVEYDITTGYGNVEPGAFRNSDYSIDEWTQLLSVSFLSWSGTNGVDVFTNSVTQQSDPFSFNYSQGKDVLFSELLPGYWRGIYKYFYDTDTPHLTPWEMLGFSQQPIWWVARYGPAPYSAGNLVLWKDMEIGLVYQHGADSYINAQYARPGLLNIIPVDEHGLLKSPNEFLVKDWNQQSAGANWRFGDQSPQETAWRRSSDYAFAVQAAWVLARPAEYCNLSLNTKDRIRVSELNQIINKKTGSRKVDLQVSGADQYVPGINIWIRDRLTDIGLDVTINFNEIFENYKLNLIYKSSGFTDKSYLQVIADQASPSSQNVGILVPQENYNLVVTKSAPVSVVSYSAIVIQKGSDGFKVYGFDTNRPYFTIIPRRYSSNFINLKVSNSSAIVYNDDENAIQVIPYGTFFSTAQQVTDFIISYGKLLTSQGFNFTDINSESGLTSDWQFAVREFIYWLEQGWDNSTVISLTPAGFKVNFNSKFGVVDDLTNNFVGSRIINSDGKTLQTKDYLTFRSGTEFELTLRDTAKGIHLLDMTTVLYEHTIIFDNTTVFNDVIYEPNLGNRQYRMKINGFKTRQWDGSLYAPGFLVNHQAVEQWMPVTDYRKGDVILHKNLYYAAKNFIPGTEKFVFSDWYEIDGSLLTKSLIPNMAFNAQQFENFYDVDRFDVNRTADMAARNSTGFVERSYLTDIGLDDISQHKFYLGLIREKGTQAAINAFLRAKLPYLDNNVQVDEQWAVKLGSYGGSTQKFDVELTLSNAQQLNGAYVIELIDSTAEYRSLWNSYKPKDLLIKPPVYDPNIFTATEKRLQTVATAGPVLIDEVDATVFDIIKINKISGLADMLGEGSRIWVGSDRNNSWNVLRASALKKNNVRITSAIILNNEIELTTNESHGLGPADIIMIRNGTIKGKKATLSGFYRINSSADKSIRVPVYPDATVTQGPMSADLLVLRSVKYSNKKTLGTDMPAKGWAENDQIYIARNDGTYEVIKNTTKWNLNQSLTPKYAQVSNQFGMAVDIKSSQDVMVAGAPSNYLVDASTRNPNGAVFVYKQQDDISWSIIDSIIPDDSHASEFGHSLKYNDKDFVTIGAPGSNSDKGIVYVANTTSNFVGVTQAIYVDGIGSNARFGQAVTASKDGIWIAVGAPGVNTVYIYKYKEVETDIRIAVLGGQDYLLAPVTAQYVGVTATDVKVRYNTKLLVPFIDYIIGTRTIDGIPTDYVVSLQGITPGADDVLEIIYENYYEYVASVDNGADNGDFGYSLSFATDGTQLIVGAPTTTNTVASNTYSNAGTVYIFDRQVDITYVDGDQTITDSTIFNLLETKTSSTLQNNLRFGHEVMLCPKTCSLYVGATGYNNSSFSNGAVYRYINTARLYGIAFGTNTSPVINVNDTLKINGVTVTFTGINAASAVTDVNNANIPGVVALTYNNLNFVLKSDNLIAYNNIIIGSSTSSAKDYFGFNVFDLDQIIVSNSDQPCVDFGNKVYLNNQADTLIIGSSTATSSVKTTFDNQTTTLDKNTTTTSNILKRSGAAYLYEYQSEVVETASNHGQMVYTQNLTVNSVSAESYFSTGITVSDNWIMITALNNLGNAGTVYSFYNTTGDKNWETIRQSPTAIDTRLVERMYLYNDNTKTLIANLPILTPEYGLPVPAAAEQIRYIVNYDPAIYTDVPNTYSFAQDSKKAWGKEHVGELWWDTNALKYVDWNQGDLVNKLNNWGLTFPNSSVNVYEWIESDLTPSQFGKTHLTDGPTYTVSEVYTSKVVIDPITLKSSTKYYFWVRNSSANHAELTRNSAIQLQNLISNPRNTNEPFAALLGTNSIALFNCQDVINSDTNLHVVMKTNVETNPVHEEWSMFDDGSDLGVAREFLDRVKDSLSGQDSQGKTVPDIDLTVKEKYGLDIRPRQTTFVDNYLGRKIWIENVNAVLANYPITLLRDISVLQDFDPVPAVNGDPIKFAVNNEIELEYYNKDFYNFGDQAVVISDSTTGGWSVKELSVDPTNPTGRIWKIAKVQAYDLRKYWSYTDWYATGYDSKTKIDKILNYEYDILSADIKEGQVVKVKYGDNGLWKLLLGKTNSFELIGQQNASITINTNLYDNLVAGFGIDSQSFEVTGFAQDSAIEFGKIFEAINYSILTKEFRPEYKKVIKAVIDSIASQFKLSDWLLKTSLINIKHHVRTLDQIPVYVKQPENIIEGFIEEAKPYHTKIKQYLSTYDKTDLAGFDSTDFDLPAYFNGSVSKYRQPQLENLDLDYQAFGLEAIDVGGVTQYVEPTAGLSNVYSSWYYNHKFNIERIDIFDGGSGYTYASSVEVQIIGDGTGASAVAYLKGGKIERIEVTNPGINYTYATVKIISQLGLGARAYAILSNGLARSFATTIKFDRFTYAPITTDWQPLTTYSVDALIIYNNIVYRAELSSIATETNITATFTTGSTFSFDNLIELVVRVWEPNKQYARNNIIVYKRKPYVALTDFTSGNTFEYDQLVTVTHSVEWQPNTYYAADTVLSYNGIAYKVASSYTSESVFGEANLSSLFGIGNYPGGYFDDAASRVWGYYNPASGMPGRDLTQVMSGLEYPGVNVLGPTFDQAPGFGFSFYEQIGYDLRTYDENGLIDIYGSQRQDSVLYSVYNDAQLGIRPEDMITDGAAYIDSYNSHAPEEFIPGHMFDALDIRVKTISASSESGAPGYRVVAYYADDFTKTFSFDPILTGYDLPMGGVESLRIVNDIDGVQALDIDYTINWQNQNVTFKTPPAAPSSVFILLIGNSGLKNIVDTEFIANGTRTKFVIEDFTLEHVQQAYIKINNVKTTDWSLITVDGNLAVQFTNAPSSGSRIQIHLFNIPISTKAYSEVKINRYTVDSGYVYNGIGYEITLAEPVQYLQPFEDKIVVRLNGSLLEPSNQAYYVGNNYLKTYSLPTTRNITDVNLITDNDIQVTVDGILKFNVIDYTIDRNGVDIPTITFVQIPAYDSQIVVSNKSQAQYSVYYNENTNISKLVINDSRVTLMPGNSIDVTIYSNHDQYNMRTQVFNGQITNTATTYLGFDEIGFDLQGFEVEKTNIITPVYTVSRPVTNMDNIRITLNGTDLIPYYDFLFATPVTLRLDPQLNIGIDDIIVVRHFGENSRTQDIEYRIFKGITETYDYLGISKNTTTRLTQDLLISDDWIYVQDISVFSNPDPIHAIPGIIFINGERITFYIIDIVNNRLGQLRRSTNGTGGADVHASGSRVYDGGFKTEIPLARDNYVQVDTETTLIGKTGATVTVPAGQLIRQGKIWYDIGSSSITNGLGLENSNTVQVNFLRDL